MAPKKATASKRQPAKKTQKATTVQGRVATNAAAGKLPSFGPESRALEPSQLHQPLNVLAMLAARPELAIQVAQASEADMAAGIRKMPLSSVLSEKNLARQTSSAPSKQSTQKGKREKSRVEGRKISCLQGITKSDLRRIARKAGCQRIAANLYAEGRVSIKDFLTIILADSFVYSKNAGRKTVVTMDVVLALRRNGRAFYGEVGERKGERKKRKRN